MATHWGSVTNNTSKFGAYIVITEVANSMNIEKNTTKVKVDFHITRSYWGWIAGSAQSGSIVIDGTSFPFTYKPNWAAGTSGDVVIASFTKEVTHSTDGSYKCSASATWNTSGTYSCGTASASGSLTLTTIPRASTPYCPDFNIGASTIINISRASSSFTHTLKYTFGNLSETIAEKTSEVNIGWQAPTDFFAEIPNAQKGTGTITCQTYNGNTLIGTKTTNFTAFVVDSEPEVEAEILDILENTLNITGDKTKLVRYVSTAEVKVTAESKNSATIASYKIKNGSKTLENKISTFEEVETGTFEITVTDSRGFSTVITKEVEIYEYIKPVYIDIELDRPSEDSTEMTANIIGQWFNGKIGNTTNTLTAQFQYSEDNEKTWSEWQNIILDANENTFSFSGSLGLNFNPEKNIVFNFAVQDMFVLYSTPAEHGKGTPYYIAKENNFTFNVHFGVNGNLDINGNIKQNGKTITSSAVTYAVESFIPDYDNVYKPIPFSKIIAGTGNYKECFSNNNGVITIGKNVYAIKLSAFVSCNPNAAGLTSIVNIYKNGVSYDYIFATSGYTAWMNEPLVVPPCLIEVEEGDIIELRVYDNGTHIRTNQTIITLETI